MHRLNLRLQFGLTTIILLAIASPASAQTAAAAGYSGKTEALSQVEAAGTSAATTGLLPFTGLGLALIVITGTCLMVLGLAIRRATSH